MRLVGPLRLSRRDGADVTPRTIKAQGLLALLGSAPPLRRPRAWLQDKLWSDRSPEHGAASLRQTVHRLRTAVGPDNDWLVSEPGWLGLDPARVFVALEPVAGDWEATGEPPEFCEGLDIADPEFEDWLRDNRLAFEDRLADEPPPPRAAPARPAPPPRPSVATLVVAPIRAEDSVIGALADILSTEVAIAVGRLGGAAVVLEEHATAELPADALRLEVDAFRVGDRARLQARLSEGGALLWSNSRSVPIGAQSRGSEKALDLFVSEVTAAAAHLFGQSRGGDDRTRRRYRAINEIFSFERTSLAPQDLLFVGGEDGPASGVLAAWRANIRVISLMERLTESRPDAEKEAVEFARLAMDRDPLNPIVNAFASEVALNVENRPNKAAELARVAVERGASSAFAHSSLAMALARLGAVGRAHASSLYALRLASSQPNPGLWHLRACITAVRCGRLGEATRFAQTAHEMAPRLKAPLRFLAAMHFHDGNEEAAFTALKTLKTLETDFSLEMMAAEGYPVATLRDSKLLAVTRSALI